MTESSVSTKGPRPLAECRIVRLNAELFPVSSEERAEYERAGIVPIECESNGLEELAPVVAEADGVFAVSVKLPAEVIQVMSRCRVISRLGAGTDRIDVAEATRSGIVVANVPDFCVEEQADHTLALLLAVERQLPRMARDMVAGHWRESRATAGQGHRLSGRTLGLVGWGLSAQATARRAVGFGMRILATRRQMQIEAPEADELGVRLVGLQQLLAESDYVSLHLPLTDASYHLLDADAFARMKPGAVLINTARGAIVDETALVAALDSGQLRGAGLDVFERINVHDLEEIPPTGDSLLGRDNVVLTPHVAAFSVESRQDIAVGGVGNLVAVLEGRWPRDGRVVNPDVTPRFKLISH
jgi:D-3-phosphoglycerate dehydrogenase